MNISAGSLTHFVELSIASFLVWCLVLLLSPWAIPGNSLLRPLIMLLIVMAMEWVPPTPLEILAAVGAVAFAYSIIGKG